MEGTVQKDWLGLHSHYVREGEYPAFPNGKEQGVVNGIIIGVAVGAILASVICIGISKSKKEKQK